MNRILPLIMALLLSLTFSSVALAHGGGETAGVPWLNMALVGAGIVVFGGAAYLGIKRRGQ